MLGFNFPSDLSNLDLFQNIVEIADHRDLDVFVEGLEPNQVSLLRGMAGNVALSLQEDAMDPENAWFDRQGIAEMFCGLEAIIKVVKLADPSFQEPEEVPWLREWLSD